MNDQSQPLQKHEIEKITTNPVCSKRFVTSYEMMLHFYGCRLKDPKTGELERHEGWKAQFKNLNTHAHNYLRITRILKSLGELGLEHYKKPFLEFFINEIWVTKELPNCDSSCENFWVGTLKDTKDREELEKKIEGFTKHQRKHDHGLLPTGTGTVMGLSQRGLKGSYIDADDESDTEEQEDISMIDEETKKNMEKIC